MVMCCGIRCTSPELQLLETCSYAALSEGPGKSAMRLLMEIVKHGGDLDMNMLLYMATWQSTSHNDMYMQGLLCWVLVTTEKIVIGSY